MSLENALAPATKEWGAFAGLSKLRDIVEFVCDKYIYTRADGIDFPLVVDFMASTEKRITDKSINS